MEGKLIILKDILKEYEPEEISQIIFDFLFNCL